MKTRKIIRLSDFDYGSSESYFVTICTFLKEPLLGRVIDDRITLTDIGNVVLKCWESLNKTYQSIQPGEFVVMPNHIHGIISLNSQNDIYPMKRLELPDIMRNFKAFTSHEYYTNKQGRRLWQRGYFDHIIRDEKERTVIIEYIAKNPTHWLRDKYYLL